MSFRIILLFRLKTKDNVAQHTQHKAVKHGRKVN